MSTAAHEVVQYVLQAHILFSILPQQEKQVLAPLFTVRQFKAGDVIAQQGSPAEGMHYFYSGQARLKENIGGRIMAVGMVQTEDTQGEMSLIGDFLWKQDIVEVEDVVCLVLPAKAVRSLLTTHPLLDQHFRSHVGLIEVSNRLKSLLGPMTYRREQLQAILSDVGVKPIKAGNTIFRQGESDPRLYLIEKGRVELVRSALAGGQEIVLDRLERGSLIGETGAISGYDGGDGQHAHTARVTDNVTAIVIREGALKQILELHPALLDRLRGRIADLRTFEKEEMDLRRRAEGVDQRIKLARGLTEEEFRRLESTKEISKFPEVRQNRDSQCAAACLTMVARHYGKTFSLGQISELTALDGEGLTPDEVIRRAEQLGIRAKGYALTYDEMKSIALPGIASWQGYRYAVVFRVTDREVHISDPENGLRTIKRDEFFANWSTSRVAGVGDIAPDRGVFISLDPTQAIELVLENWAGY